MEMKPDVYVCVENERDSVKEREIKMRVSVLVREKERGLFRV
jgi:hypothetical protein